MPAKLYFLNKQIAGLHEFETVKISDSEKRKNMIQIIPIIEDGLASRLPQVCQNCSRKGQTGTCSLNQNARHPNTSI